MLAKDQIAAADIKRAEALAGSFRPARERPTSDIVPPLMPPAAKPQ